MPFRTLHIAKIAVMKRYTLKTDRLKVFPLSLQQLINIQNGDALEPILGMPAAPGLISPPVLNAMAVKIHNMEEASEKDWPWFTYWLMAAREEKTGIGLAGFKGTPDAQGKAEIGYGVSSDYEGKGYTTEAVKALVDWAFLQSGCRAVTAETRLSNPASQRVLLKAGFQLQGGDEELLYWQIEKP